MNTSINSSNVGSYSSSYHQRPVSSYASASAPSYASVPIPPRPHSTVPSSSAPVRHPAVPVQLQASVPTQIPAVAPAHSATASVSTNSTITNSHPDTFSWNCSEFARIRSGYNCQFTEKNPNLKQHLPTILRNLQQIALQKSNTNNEDKKPSTERHPLSEERLKIKGFRRLK